MAHSTSLNPYNYLEKEFVIPFSMERNRLHSSWGHGAAKRPSCLLNTALSDWETHAMATVPHWEAQTATGNDTFSFSSPSQPLGSSRGNGGQQLLALTPCRITPTGSRQQPAQRENKGSSFSLFFRNLDSSMHKQPLGLVATMATGYPSLSNYVNPDHRASCPFPVQAPSPPAAHLTSGQL